MSSKNNQQSGAQSGSKKAASATVIRKDKAVEMKTVVGGPVHTEFKPGVGAYKDSILVVATDGHRTVNRLFHHPFGVNPLDEKDYVSTDLADMETLAAQLTDPDAARLAMLQDEYRLDMAVGAGLLSENATTGARLYPNGDSRDAAIAAAKVAATTDLATRKSGWTGGGSKGPKPEKSGWKAFLSEPHTAAEQALDGYWKQSDVKKNVAAAWPSTFQTRSGPYFDQDQVSCVPADVNPPGAGGAFDGLIYQIAKLQIMSLTDAKDMVEARDRAESAVEEPDPSGAPDGAATGKSKKAKKKAKKDQRE